MVTALNSHEIYILFVAFYAIFGDYYIKNSMVTKRNPHHE